MYLIAKFILLFHHKASFENHILDQIDSSSFLVDTYANSTENLIGESDVQLRRVKRSIVQLGGIIRCITGCKPLSYNRYGCFCGASNIPGKKFKIKR